MSLPQGEYQIPETEYTQIPSQPEVFEASPVIDTPQYVAQNDDSFVRGTLHYENRPAILAQEAERRSERQAVIKLGSDIFALRQAEIEKRLTGPSSNVFKQVLNMIMTGQVGMSVDKDRLADETFRSLMNEESAIGASLIPMPSTVARQEFFLSDSRPDEWFYHAQSLIQPDKSRTIRYVVSEPDGVYKSIDGGQYASLDSAELSDFLEITKAYADRLKNGSYKNVSRSDFGLAA